MNYTVLFGFFKTIISHSKRLEVDGSKTSIVAKIYPKGASLLSFPSFIPLSMLAFCPCAPHLTGLSQLSLQANGTQGRKMWTRSLYYFPSPKRA